MAPLFQKNFAAGQWLRKFSPASLISVDFTLIKGLGRIFSSFQKITTSTAELKKLTNPRQTQNSGKTKKITIPADVLEAVATLIG